MLAEVRGWRLEARRQESGLEVGRRE